MVEMRDPILISAFLSLGVCLTRALVDAAAVVPPVCARCLRRFERKGGDDRVCACDGTAAVEARAASDA